MDTINQRQPEDTRKPLDGAEAVAKLKELAGKAETCFFCTAIKTGLPVSTRPMAVLEVDDEGNFWFLSAKDSDMNKEIAKDPLVQLFSQATPHSGFLNVYGIAEISFEQARIDALWKPLAKVWFTEGKEDPLISVIKVSPTQGYYWDNKHGNLIAFAKMAASLIIGKTLDDSVEGKITV